jgi:fatty-acyl-CoA synthase
VTAVPTGADPGPSVAELLVARSEDDHPALRFEDEQWSWREVVSASATRASWIRSAAGPDPFHVGVLLGNVPEYIFWLGAAALAGAVVVGINPTRRGQALAGDIGRTDCAVVVTDAEGARLLDGLELPVPPERVIRVDGAGYTDLLAPHAGADCRSLVAACAPARDDLYLLLFTSGTTGAPKAVRCTQGRLASIAVRSAEAYGFGRDDVAYCTMPLFHGNALMVLWGPSLVVGATVALARRFTASGFVADVRRYGATTFTYVGKALAYVLATPPSPADASITLRRGFGTEASVADHTAFERRFGCVLTEGYGSSEGPRTRRWARSAGRWATSSSSTPRPRRNARRPGSTPPAGWSTEPRPSARSSIVTAWAGSRGTTPMRRPPRPEPGTAGTGPGIWPSATRTASSTSPAGAATGCGWTRRT